MADTLNTFSRLPHYMWFGTNSISISTTAVQLNAAFSYGASGTACLYKFTAPKGQTSAGMTVHLRMSAKAGTPTSITADIYRGAQSGQDPQRPEAGGASQGTATVDASGTSAPNWITFSFSSVTLVQGATYWIVVANTTATPASNNISLLTRGYNTPAILNRLTAWSTSDGITTDPTIQSSATEPPCVIKFSDGSLFGNPYCVSTAHANNGNDRGLRFTFPFRIEIAGVYTILPSTSTFTIKVYQGSTLIASVTPDVAQQNTSGPCMYFSSPVIFEANTAYDVIQDPSGNDSFAPRIDAGSSPPTDVSDLLGTVFQYVDGATPGSYSVVGGITGINLIPNGFPLPTVAA